MQVIKNLTLVLGNSSDPNHEDGLLEGVHGRRRRTRKIQMGTPIYGFDAPYTGAQGGSIVR
ncbi:hypothetical protein Z517_04902 [Fonsecaea pedrosoi CBS 271.37]|uniref:Uncharacterized protein n=1 Tax=Fonsecaea pedrosoi CBS 271.37 TaxID=1442368 RepID=A0A0D2DVN5_9EURO|nr:uncharacterized protein Z517_04902 [Fonsecaea pedrosoi CBS 271.37]KIW81876.1 hypothetical protein Z517_04902 [Fonsecaea pedrosoi CBS 271.37]